MLPRQPLERVPPNPMKQCAGGVAQRGANLVARLARSVRTPAGVRMSFEVKQRTTRLAWKLFWSHAVLASILLLAVGITLSGLIGMNAMIAEVKNLYLTDFEEEERIHRAAWAIETEARHGALTCELRDGARAEVAARMTAASRELDTLLRDHVDRISPAMERAVRGYQEFGARLADADACARLRDPGVDRQRLLLDEKLTDAWIGKLRELRLAILEKEMAAQRIGSWATWAGLGLGLLSVVAAVFAASSMARGVTVPLSLLAAHARRLGEGDFSRLPALDGPYEVGLLSRELDRMRARLSEVNQLKQAFLGSVSHDLRTPLAHMREALNLLIDGAVGPLTPKQQRVAALALRACEREIRLVSALLDLSRIRSGRPLMLTRGGNVDDVIANAFEHVQDAAQRAGVALELEAEGTVPALSLDAVLVETALVNVLDNAIAASAPGQRVKVRRALTRDSPERAGIGECWLRVVVEDEGAGVAAELRDKIFEPFYSTKGGERTGGSGLGLPLAREMIRAHGGELSLIAPRAAGAAFALWLPLVAVGAGSYDSAGPVQGPASAGREAHEGDEP
jgi:two-component system sensor histidine kinase GlrK